MSSALRENLSMALGDALDKEIINGSDGLLNGTNLDNHNVSAATTYDLFLKQFGFGPRGRTVCRKCRRPSLGNGA